MGIARVFDRGTSTDSTGRTLDRVDLAGTPQQLRVAQRELVAMAQRDELVREQQETNRLLRALLEAAHAADR